jgi:hypothetical protein
LILILGNGLSRLAFDKQIKEFEGEVWACNYAFREYPEKITRLTGHTEPLEEAEKEKAEKGYKFDIYSGVCAKKKYEWKTFTVNPRWLRDSGTTLIAQALHEGKKVILCGFDLGGPDVYCTDQWKQNKRTWVKRMAEIIKEWGSENIEFWGFDHMPFIKNVFSGVERDDKYWQDYRKRKPHIKDETYQKIFYKRIVDGKEAKKRKRLEMEKEAVLVRYPNGYEAWVNKRIAEILIKKGSVTEVKKKVVNDTKGTSGSGSRNNTRKPK